MAQRQTLEARRPRQATSPITTLDSTLDDAAVTCRAPHRLRGALRSSCKFCAKNFALLGGTGVGNEEHAQDLLASQRGGAAEEQEGEGQAKAEARVGRSRVSIDGGSTAWASKIERAGFQSQDGQPAGVKVMHLSSGTHPLVRAFAPGPNALAWPKIYHVGRTIHRGLTRWTDNGFRVHSAHGRSGQYEPPVAPQGYWRSLRVRTHGEERCTPCGL